MLNTLLLITLTCPRVMLPAAIFVAACALPTHGEDSMRTPSDLKVDVDRPKQKFLPVLRRIVAMDVSLTNQQNRENPNVGSDPLLVWEDDGGAIPECQLQLW